MSTSTSRVTAESAEPQSDTDTDAPATAGRTASENNRMPDGSSHRNATRLDDEKPPAAASLDHAEGGEPELTASSPGPVDLEDSPGAGAPAGLDGPAIDDSVGEKSPAADSTASESESLVGRLAGTAAHTTPADRQGSAPGGTPAVRLRGARLSYGERTLWEGLDLEVAPGEFIAILGPNGSGKTSLLRMLLGQLAPSAGSVEVAGSPARVGNPHIGYVPQQKTIDSGVPLRGVDLVGLGVDGHRWGLGWRGRKERKRKVADAIAQVGAQHYAHAPLESMSGGEQQRLRVAQALVGDPRVLLCDEPLLSLDMANQRLVAELINARRRSHDTAVMFVTHEINPVLPLVDRVLYLVEGEFRIGTPDEVMTSEVLSELYRTEVDVLRVRGRLVVVGTGDAAGDQA
ncbi:zinc/manganese transport system ATP-binding protein [Nocardia sp. GAS34]